MSVPLIQLHQVCLGFGGFDVFKNIDLVLNVGARFTRSSLHITAPVMNSFQILSASQKDSDWLVAHIFSQQNV